MGTRRKDGTYELDMDCVAQNLQDKLADHGRDLLLQEMQTLQVAVFVMCGGGFLGRSAAEQPAGFYIDDRVGELPYKRRDIRQAVEVLECYASVLGVPPSSLPEFHNCGVF